jgi:hypothetical protein
LTGPQNIQFGAARASRLGGQVAAHSGGYFACLYPQAVQRDWRGRA